MPIDFILRSLERNRDVDALIWKGSAYKSQEILDRASFWEKELAKQGITSGTVVSLKGDFSLNSVSIFIALIKTCCILVPQSNISNEDPQIKIDISESAFLIDINTKDQVDFLRFNVNTKHPLYSKIREAQHPGLVLFSSGTSGTPKAAVHDLIPLLEKFQHPRRPLITLNFLLFDHWGGLNTLLTTLSSGGTTVTVQQRSPEEVCSLIESYRIELLPATPSFLNLLLLSNAPKKYNLSSLKTITYGAEPMPHSTLELLNKSFPNTKIQQTYGLIEVGVLQSKSKGNDSLWVKIGGSDYSLRVVNGMLEIKTKSMILGYLNAPSPITEDGWFQTGDAVEVDGEFLKILGRKSELINVGGEKVYPTEIENIILKMDNVADVVIYPEKNLLLGNIVCATVLLKSAEDYKEFEIRLKKYCSMNLEKYKVPVKISISDLELFNSRFKKSRAKI